MRPVSVAAQLWVPFTALFAFLLVDHWLMPQDPQPSAQALEFIRSGT